MRNYRDLTLLAISKKKQLVIACDSSAGIGQKKHDLVVADPEIMAAFCLRVPLLELLCFGAKPLAVVDLIGNELEPTGKQMLTGIKNELAKAGFSEVLVNGSTEENMRTTTTSIGVTVIGEAPVDRDQETPQPGDYLLQLGTPYVGTEVIANLGTIFSYGVVQELRQYPGVIDMLPVGSKGIGYEAAVMSANADTRVRFEENVLLDKSAGPATVVLAAVKAAELKAVMSKYPMLQIIGRFQLKRGDEIWAN